MIIFGLSVVELGLWQDRLGQGVQGEFSVEYLEFEGFGNVIGRGVQEIVKWVWRFLRTKENVYGCFDVEREWLRLGLRGDGRGVVEEEGSGVLDFTGAEFEELQGWGYVRESLEGIVFFGFYYLYLGIWFLLRVEFYFFFLRKIVLLRSNLYIL